MNIRSKVCISQWLRIKLSLWWFISKGSDLCIAMKLILKMSYKRIVNRWLWKDKGETHFNWCCRKVLSGIQPIQVFTERAKWSSTMLGWLGFLLCTKRTEFGFVIWKFICFKYVNVEASSKIMQQYKERRQLTPKIRRVKVTKKKRDSYYTVGENVNQWKWKVKVKSLSRVWLLASPRTAAYQAPPSMGFSREEWGAIAFSHINQCSYYEKQ